MSASKRRSAGAAAVYGSWLISFGFMMLAPLEPATAQCSPSEIANLTGTTPFFGTSVAIDGNTAVVGAVPSFAAQAPGTASVFLRASGTWTLQQTLTAGIANDRFGESVAIQGNTIVVGAPGSTNAGGVPTGLIYVYTRTGTTWTHQPNPAPSDLAAQDSFGSSVAIDNNTIVAGAASKALPGNIVAGVAYVFLFNGTSLTQQQRIESSNPTPAARFGHAVGISGNTIVVGAPNERGTIVPPSAQTGAAHVFTRSTSSSPWVESFAFAGSAHFMEFGASVDIDGGTILIGAPENFSSANTGGSAFFFVGGGSSWSAQGQVAGATGDHLGTAVALEGDKAVIGVPFSDPGAVSNAGSVRLLVRSSGVWTTNSTLAAAAGSTNDHLGVSVAIFGNSVISGAHFNVNAGSAYVFDLFCVGWANLGGGLSGSTGIPTLVGSGPLVGGQPITLTLSNAAPSAIAPLIFGGSAVYGQIFGGELVPSPDDAFDISTNGSGIGVFSATFPTGVTAGATLYFQALVVDSGAPQGFAFSNAVLGVTP